MQRHGPKRVYTQGSLEFWFDKLERSWDDYFRKEDLEAGRTLYREGGIREVELGSADAIIHVKFDKKEEYSVLEWNEKGLVVRSSTSDTGMANMIAVAGLHEIEELVADEILPVPEATEAPSNGTSASKPKPPREREDEPARELILRLISTEDGLACETEWKAESGERHQALGNQDANAPVVNQAERGKLISLAAQARKAHFRFSSERQAYLLDQIKEIPYFLKNVLPVWQKSFTVEQNANVDRLAVGVQSVQIEARAKRSEGNLLDLEWIFRSGEKLLSDVHVRELAGHAGGQIIIPEIGMVTVSEENIGTLTKWQESASETYRNELPAYLLFSLFKDRHWKLELSEELEKWRTELISTNPAKYSLPDFLRPYQRRGVDWMAHLCDHGCHGLLADEMGLGKTVQVITLIAKRPLGEVPHLVVCPASVVPVWREEIARFYPGMSVFVLDATTDFVSEQRPGIWLASYAQLRNHWAMLDKVEFGYAVLDEGQFIKNPDAKITNACFAIRAKHRIVLTGTPLENRQLDLWSIFNYLLPGLLGSRQDFESALAGDREGTVERLRLQLAPFILRRTKAEVAKELPQKVEIDLHCPMSDLQKREYARVCTEGLARLGSDIGEAMREKSFGFLSLLTRLRQICCDPDLLPWLSAGPDESGKLTLLVDKLAEVLAGGHKVVIFSQFVMLLKRVHEVLDVYFPELPRFDLTGATVDRQKPVQEFQNLKGEGVILVSLKAAGTGITLHAADYVFLLDPWWNPAVEDQAVDRVHRIGQTRTVFVYRMVTSGTIEERIQDLKAEKKQLFQRVIDGVSGELDIRQHFSSLNSLIEFRSEVGE